MNVTSQHIYVRQVESVLFSVLWNMSSEQVQETQNTSVHVELHYDVTCILEMGLSLELGLLNWCMHQMWCLEQWGIQME